MSKRRARKRGYRMIAFKAYLDTDADILDWWDSIEAGERSDALRDLIRVHTGLHSRQRKPFVLPEMTDIRRDILWIHDALNDMPDYLERLMQHWLLPVNRRCPIPALRHSLPLHQP
jgi:hypothetical protein